MGTGWVSQAQEEVMVIAEMLGIHIKDIYFSGFENWEKICFTGSYHFIPSAQFKVRQFHANDLELRSLADRLFEAQNDFNLSCTVRHSGSYNHDGCTEFTWSTDANGWWLSDFEDALAEEMKEVLRSFMKWMYRKLEEDYTYQTSDEAMVELCSEHDFEFFENGEPIN
jgi:hypothetical protein